MFQSFNTCYKDTGLWGIYFVCGGLDIRDMFFNIQVWPLTQICFIEIFFKKKLRRTH